MNTSRIEVWRPIPRVPLRARIASLSSRRDLAAMMVQNYNAKEDTEYAKHYSTVVECLNHKIIRLSERWGRIMNV